MHSPIKTLTTNSNTVFCFSSHIICTRTRLKGMPVNGATSKGSSGPSRTTFRPPWVKDADGDKAPSPSRLKSAEKGDGVKKTAAAADPKENGQPKQMSVKLQSREVKVPVMTETRRPSQQLLKPKKKEPEPEPESETESEEESEEESSSDSEPKKPPPKVVKKPVELKKVEETKPVKRRENEKLPRKDSTTDATEKPRNKFMGEVKLKPVLKKTPNIDELPERPKSMLLETPVLKKVVKPDPDELPEKPRNVLPEQPVLKKVVKKEAPIVPKTSDTEWNNFQLKGEFSTSTSPLSNCLNVCLKSIPNSHYSDP